MKTKFYTRLASVLATLMMCLAIASAQTTVTSQIVDPLDDAEEYASDVGGEVVGQVYNNSSDLELVFDSEVQYVGLIFRNVAVPVGAVITNAFVQFQVDALSEGTTDAALTLEIYGIAQTATLPTWDSNVPFQVSSLPATTAKVTWQPGPSVNVGDRTENERTADIAAIIQEIIGLAGWASGGNIGIVIKWTGDQNQTENINREMESADGDAAGAPELSVTYVESTGVNSIRTNVSSIYPNPTRGMVNIDNPSNDFYSYRIYSINGQLVASGLDIAGSTTQVDVSDLAKGLYFVDVISAERTKTHKLIIE